MLNNDENKLLFATVCQHLLQTGESVYMQIMSNVYPWASHVKTEDWLVYNAVKDFNTVGIKYS